MVFSNVCVIASDRYRGVIGRSPGLRRTINYPKGLTTISSRNLRIQVQDPQKDVYLPKTSSTCRLILLAAVDLVASQLLFSRCPPTARRTFIRSPLFSRHSYFRGTKLSTVLFAISTLVCIDTSKLYRYFAVMCILYMYVRSK